MGCSTEHAGRSQGLGGLIRRTTRPRRAGVSGLVLYPAWCPSHPWSSVSRAGLRGDLRFAGRHEACSRVRRWQMLKYSALILRESRVAEKSTHFFELGADPVRLCRPIRHVREQLGLTLAQFATRVGAAGKAVVYQWESRKRCPAPVFWERIQAAMREG
jgi:hypothetical protein